MSVLWAARCAMIGSIVVYALGLVVGRGPGLLLVLAGVYAMPVAALACVITQILTLGGRKRKPEEKPD